MEVIMGLACTWRQHEYICVIVDKNTKSTHSFFVKTINSIEEYAKLYGNEIVRLHGFLFISSQAEDLILPIIFLNHFEKV